jgi:hypothetical protein
MTERGEGKNPGRGRRPGRWGGKGHRRFSKGPRPGNGGGARSGGKRGGQGSIGLVPLGDGNFELSHPRAVDELEPDYEEGIELWREGDPESARDALRYALSACQNNLWVHVALGRIALDEFRDPALARGHFGYAVELGQRALPRRFSGRLPRDRRNNRPLYEAIDGLVQCFEALGLISDCRSLRALGDRLSRGTSS